MGFYLGIDAGGTKTECWLGDEARVLAKGSTGTVKLMNIGVTTATERLQDLIRDVVAQASVDTQSIARTVVGLAGSSSDSVRTWAESSLANFISGEVLVLGDEEIALDAAFADGPGILVIAGTGSNIVGRCADGRKFSSGGWGPVAGDEGSGYWIGLEALRSALRARDRGVETTLLEAIQQHWQLASLGDLIAHANSAARIPFGELTHVVVAASDKGDPLAIHIFQRAADELAEAVMLVAKKMSAAGCASTEAQQIAFAGSVLGHITAVRTRFIDRVHAAIPGSAVRETAIEPLEGALWKARRG